MKGAARLSLRQGESRERIDRRRRAAFFPLLAVVVAAAAAVPVPLSSPSFFHPPPKTNKQTYSHARFHAQQPNQAKDYAARLPDFARRLEACLLRQAPTRVSFWTGVRVFWFRPPPSPSTPPPVARNELFFFFFLSLAVTIGDFKDLSFETFQPLSGPFAHGES